MFFSNHTMKINILTISFGFLSDRQTLRNIIDQHDHRITESEKRKNKKSIKILLEITYKIEYHE